MSIDEVARRSGVNSSTISRAERGLINASDSTKKRIAKVFRWPDPDALFRPVDAAAGKVA